MSAQKEKEQVDPGSLALLTRQVRNFLSFHQEMGLAAYPALPELRQFLTHVQKRVQKQQPASSSVSQQGRAEGQHPNSFPQNKSQVAPQHNSAPEPQQAPASPETASVQQQLQALNQELVQCRSCASGTSEAEPEIITGQGSPTPRLLVVGDYFLGTNREQGLLWGKEEDAMLWRMMQAIGLEKESVYVTNAIKCPQSVSVQPGSAQEHACFSHLKRELQIIQPKLICAMGDAACRAVLRTKAPLARLRGRFHTYKYSTGAIGKIMPTYHPRLLLQHPEMKRATWSDLQAVQRALQAGWP